MYDFEDYERYCEPSEIDQLVEEFRNKCREFILPNIKDEIIEINKENLDLKIKNEEYKKRENQIINKEKDLKRKEDNLKREVENEFYETNIGKLLAQYIEESEVWFAEKTGFAQYKCLLCNDKRKLVAKFPNGEETIKDCACNKLNYKYIPKIATLNLIKFSRKNSKYQSERKFYLSKTYSPGKSHDYDDFDYREFRIQHIINEFTEETKELYGELNYGEKLGYIAKEQCQIYCDWINDKYVGNSVESYPVPKHE